MDAISGSGIPAAVRVHIGTYGVNREASITVHTYGPGRYSPIFKAEVRTAAWEERTLTPEEERKVSRRFAGRVPDEPALLQAQETFAKHLNLTLTPSLDGIKFILDFLAEQRPALKGKNPAEFVNVSFLKKLEEEGFFKKLSSNP